MERFLDEIQFNEWNRQQDIGRSFSEGVVELSERFPQYAALIHAFDARWEETLAGIFPQCVAILEQLHLAGYPLYALSNWSVEKFSIVRQRYEFLNWFDEIVISGAVGIAKPDPGIYRYLLDRIHREPRDCLFIDDSSSNVAVAKDLGFQTLHFQSPKKLATDLTEAGIMIA